MRYQQQEVVKPEIFENNYQRNAYLDQLYCHARSGEAIKQVFEWVKDGTYTVDDFQDFVRTVEDESEHRCPALTDDNGMDRNSESTDPCEVPNEHVFARCTGSLSEAQQRYCGVRAR